VHPAGLFVPFVPQKPKSECHIEQIIRTIAEWSEYCVLFDAVGGCTVQRIC